MTGVLRRGLGSPGGRGSPAWPGFHMDLLALPIALARASLRGRCRECAPPPLPYARRHARRGPSTRASGPVSGASLLLFRSVRVTPGREREGKLRLVGETRAWPTAERGDRIPDALPRPRLVEEGEAIHASRRRARRGPQERAERACAPPAAGAEEAEIEVRILAAGKGRDSERTHAAPGKRQQRGRAAQSFARHDNERLSAGRRADRRKLGLREGLVRRGAVDRFQLGPVPMRLRERDEDVDACDPGLDGGGRHARRERRKERFGGGQWVVLRGGRKRRSRKTLNDRFLGETSATRA